MNSVSTATLGPRGSLLLVLVLAAGVGLALYNALTLPIWYDETITLLQLSGNPTPKWEPGLITAAEHRLQFEGYSDWSAILPMLYHGDVHPPLYYFAALAWSKTVGKELFDVRLFSLLCLLASAVILGLSLRRFGYFASFAATALFLFAPMIQWSGASARDYALAMLLTVSCFALVLRSLDRQPRAGGRAADWQAIGVAGIAGLAFYSHYFSILITLPMLVYVLTIRSGSYAYRMAAVVLFSVMVAAILPLVVEQMGARPAVFSGFGPLLNELVNLARLYLTAPANQAEDLWLGRIQLVALALLLPALAGYLLLRRESRQLAIFLCSTLAGFAGLILLLFYVTDKTLAGSFGGGARYTMFVIPPLVTLIGVGLDRLSQRNLYLASGLLVLLAFPVTATWFHGGVLQAPWKFDKIQIVREALKEAPSEQAVVIVPLGWGRGGPGTWAYELNGSTQMLVVSTDDDLQAAYQAIADTRTVVLVIDETDRLTASKDLFAARLESAGFITEEGWIYRMPSRDSEGRTPEGSAP